MIINIKVLKCKSDLLARILKSVKLRKRKKTKLQAKILTEVII